MLWRQPLRHRLPAEATRTDFPTSPSGEDERVSCAECGQNGSALRQHEHDSAVTQQDPPTSTELEQLRASSAAREEAGGKMTSRHRVESLPVGSESLSQFNASIDMAKKRSSTTVHQHRVAVDTDRTAGAG